MAVKLDALQRKQGNEMNLSLLKLGPITQVTIGIIITVMVLLATGVTVAVVVTRTKFEAPIAAPDNYEIYKNGISDWYVMNNDKDPRNDELKIIGVSTPEYGTVKNIGGKYVHYKAPAKYSGKDTFIYTVSNSKMSTTALVTVTVKNHAPEPVDFEFTISKNSKFEVNNFDLLSWRTGIDNQPERLRGIKDTFITDLDEEDDIIIIDVTKPKYGEIKFDTKTIHYQPEVNSIKEESVTYFITDGNATTNGTIKFIVKNDKPVAKPDFYEIPINTVGYLDVLSNDFDPNGDEIFIDNWQLTPIMNSQVDRDPFNSKILRYLPKPFIPGKTEKSDTFVYIITDSELIDDSYVVIKLINLPPTAGDYFVEVPVNAVDFPVEVKYSDENPGQTLFVELLNQPKEGTKRILNNNEETRFFSIDESTHKYTWITYNLTYTPIPNNAYDDIIEYKVFDGIDSTIGYIRIKVVNSAPIAVTDEADCNKNTGTTNYNVEIDVLANDYDPNGDQIKLNSVTPSQNGGSTIKYNGKVRYTAPKNGFVGKDYFTYEIEDQLIDPTKNLRATGKVYVNVYNTKPVAIDDEFTILKGSTKNLHVLGNDYDINGDSLSIVPSEEKSTLGIDVSQIVKDNYEGKPFDHIVYTSLRTVYVDTFYYTITDGDLSSEKAKVTINVINVPPKCNDDQVTTLWNSTDNLRSVDIDVLANDEDENPGDKENLKIFSITQEPSHGIIEIINDKIIKYTPELNYVGIDTIKYKAVDDSNEVSTNEGVVTITVINNAPIAVDDSYTNHKWGVTKVYNVMENDYDPDDKDKIYFKEISVYPPNSDIAELSIVDGNKIEFKAKKVLGDIKFKYKITDLNKESEAEVTVNVYNNPPIAVDDSLTIHWNSGEQIIYVLDNDIKFEDPIEIKSVDPPTGFKGTIIVSEDKKTLKFTPDLSEPIFLGTQTVSYTITDQQADSTANVVITLTNNNKPVAIPKTFSIHWRTTTSRVDVLTTSKDNDNDDLTLSIIQNPNKEGTATIKTDTVQYIEYKQKDNRLITEEFTYQISDKAEKSSAKVEFTVYNHPPEAEDIYENIPYNADPEKMNKEVDVLSKATDDDIQDLNFLDIKSFGSPSNGVVSIVTKDGKKQLKYTPNPQFKGEDSFEYTVTDGLEDVIKTITIKILSAPIQDQIKSYRIHWKTQTAGSTFPVMLGLADPITGDLYQISSTVKYPLHALDYHIVQEGNKKEKIFYKQQTNYIGTDEIHVNYTNGENYQTVFIYIEVYNNRPIAVSKSVSTHWKNQKTINLMEGSSDPDGILDTIHIKENTNPTTGTLTVSSNGIATYTPFNPPTKSSDSFKFKITDDHLDSSEQEVSISITNLAPIAIDKSATLHWRAVSQQGHLFDLLEDSSDPNNDPISIKFVTDPDSNKATLVKDLPNGKIYYKPKTGQTGTQTFTYGVTDGYQDTIKQITMTVNNQKPIGGDDNYEYQYNQFPKVFEVLSNDHDDDPEDHPNLIIKQIKLPSGSLPYQATIVENGKKIKFEPNYDFQGEVTFKYIITDGYEDSDEITVNVKVIAPSAPYAEDKTDTIIWRNGLKQYNLKLSQFGGAAGTEITCEISSPGLYGTLSNVNNNECKLDYTPKAIINYNLIGVNGRKEAKEDITFTVTDRFDRQITKKLTIIIYNTAPIANNDIYNFQRHVSNPEKIYDILLNDVDGDSDNKEISYVEEVSDVLYARASIDKKNLLYKPNPGWIGTKNIKYKITDGQLESNVAEVAITVLNTAPVCTPIVKLLTKGVTTNIKLIDGVCSDVNGDTLTVKSISLTSGNLGSVVKNGNDIQFTHSPAKSGTQVITYIVSDGVAEISSTLTINIINNAPTAIDRSLSFSKQTAPYIIDIKSLSDAKDNDAGDTISLTQLIGTCAGGSFIIENQKIKFTRNTGWQGTCSIDFKFSDNDNNNPLSVTKQLTVTVTNSLPIATNKAFTTKQGTPITIPIATILVGCFDPDEGETVEFAGFDFTKCRAKEGGFQCKTEPYQSGTNIIWPSDANYCQTDKVEYKIRTKEDPSSVTKATLSLTFTGCICQTPADIVFILDGSSSISASDWTKLKTFSRNLASKFTLSPTGVNIGVVQFATYATVSIPMQTSSTALDNSLKNLGQILGGTATIIAFDFANEKLLLPIYNNLNNPRRTYPKVMILVTDGVPTLPVYCNQEGTGTYVNNANQWGAYSCYSYYYKIRGWTNWEDHCYNSPTFGYMHCTTCYNNYFNKVSGCTDMTKVTNIIKTWRKASGTRLADWKIITVGVGEALVVGSEGYQQLQAASYDPTKVFSVDFNDLNSIASDIVDIACDSNNM